MSTIWSYAVLSLVTGVALWIMMWWIAERNKLRRPRAAWLVQRAVIWLICGQFLSTPARLVTSTLSAPASVSFVIINLLWSIPAAIALLHIAYAALMQPDRLRAPMNLS